jgi:hypothetical protein
MIICFQALPIEFNLRRYNLAEREALRRCVALIGHEVGGTN